MAVERGVCGCARKDSVVLLKWSMDACPRVSVLLGETKVNDISLVAMNTGTNQKVGGFDVAMNKMG